VQLEPSWRKKKRVFGCTQTLGKKEYSEVAVGSACPPQALFLFYQFFGASNPHLDDFRRHPELGGQLVR
jgi:hypothetical protein